MSATATQSNSVQLNVLGRYRTPEGGRVLVGRRIEGHVYVYDYPESGNGRRYFVEKGFQSKGELAVLIADYRRQAERVGTCPMSCEATRRAFALTPAGPIPAQDRTP
jgi:hypothetical protein